MRIVVCGSRIISNRILILDAIRSYRFYENISEIVTGGAIGVDEIADKIAGELKFDRTIMYPNWEKYGKKAGFLRNKKMIEYANGLIAIWDGKSKGTKHSINLAEKRYTNYFVHVCKILDPEIYNDSK